MVVRIGIIGFGWVAKDYMVPAIAAHPAAELVAVASVRPEDFAGLHPEIDCYTDGHRLLEAGDLDAVYVATPNHLHREFAVAAAEAELHVLCEKPVAPTSEEAAVMIGAAASAGVVYATAFDQRHHPAHRRLRELIASGELGRLTQLRLDYACWLPSDWCADNWRIDPERAGGGAVIDLAPHGLDLIEFITGERITDIHCVLQRAAHDYPVDDGGILSLRLDNDILAGMHVGYNRPDEFPRRRLEVFGTEGYLIAENTMGQTPGGRLRYQRAGSAEMEDILFDRTASPFYLQLDDFLRQVTDSNYTPPRSPTDDLRLVGLLEGVMNVPTPWH